MIRSSVGAALAVAVLTCAGPLAAQGSTHLVSRASDGTPAGDYSGGGSVSADGRFVAFHCVANHLVPDDSNALMDAFVQDRASGITRRVSVAWNGSEADGESWDPRISGDGRFVTFWSEAANLVPLDTNGVHDVFVHDLQSGATVRASVSSTGEQAEERSFAPSLSFDGRYVVFHSFASNLDPLDGNGFFGDVFVRDLRLGTTTLVSLTATGGSANGWCQWGTISDDGRFVAFSAFASNLVPGDSNGAVDVYVRDRLLATTTLASRATSGFAGNGESTSAWVSGDGRFVAFSSVADDLVPGDTNGIADIFLHEIAAGLTERVSLSSTGAQSTGASLLPSLSIDGRSVAFISGDGNLVPGDGNGDIDVFVRDLASGTTRLASQSTSGIQGLDFSTYPAISGNGRFVAFESPADNLVELAAPAQRNVFLRDTRGCAPTGAVFCRTGTSTHGCRPSISASGIPDADAGAGFAITVGGVEGQELGLIFYGCTGPAAALFGGGSSVLCIQDALQRTDVQSAGGTAGACDGQLMLDWNQFVATHPDALEVPFLGGETVWAQAWYRDPLAPSGSNLSDALWFDVCD